MIGLNRGYVALFEHNTDWEEEAHKTINELKILLDDVICDIEHVGSTAIKTIKAKPIIDIALAVKSFEDILKYNDLLEDNGFYIRQDANTNNQLLYACGNYCDGTGLLQTHFIHVVLAGSQEWHNYIKFRDYLNDDFEIANEYERIKLDALNKSNSRYEYTTYKQQFITDILNKI